MNFVDFDFDRAMCVYLGGEHDSGGIQIGRRDDRLAAEYGSDAPRVKEMLDGALEAAFNRAEKKVQTIDELLALQFPNTGSITRKKIAAYVIYRIQH